MAEKKLSFNFHNPNGADETAGRILHILIESNRAKLDEAIRLASSIDAEPEKITANPKNFDGPAS